MVASQVSGPRSNEVGADLRPQVERDGGHGPPWCVDCVRSSGHTAFISLAGLLDRPSGLLLSMNCATLSVTV
jgi:hypothetical protein